MLERAEKIAKIFSLLAIPIVLAWFGISFQSADERAKTALEYVKLSVSIVEKQDQVDPYLLEWAVKVLNHYAPVSMSNRLQNSLERGESSIASAVSVPSWFAVIGSLDTLTEAKSLSGKLEATKPQELSKFKLRIYETKISKLFALTIGEHTSKAEAIRRAKIARDYGWVSDAFAQPNKEWTPVE